MAEPILVVESVVTRFGEAVIHDGVSFSVPAGQIVALIGGSGSGKTVLLKEILGLARPSAGTIRLFGQDIVRCSEAELAAVRRRYGMLFQYSALFSSLSVGENVAVPLTEEFELPADVLSRLVSLRLALVGLATETALKMPSELSGGMKKRAALARALVLEPELLFLDEPTSGLDPISARAFDKLIRTLNESLGLTVFMATHDLDSILAVADRIIVLGEGRVLADGTVSQVRRVEHPWIRSYFSARGESMARHPNSA